MDESSSTCRFNPPAASAAGGCSFPVVDLAWWCGRWRSVAGAMLGAKPKLSDREIYEIVGQSSLPSGPDIPCVALKRSEIVAELVARGMTHTPAIKRIQTLVGRGVLKMGPNPWPRAYPTPGIYYWVEPEGAAAAVVTGTDAILDALREEAPTVGRAIGIREFMRRRGSQFGISLATLQRRLESLAHALKAGHTDDGKWYAAAGPEMVEVE